ncbi:SHOCT domain-containing protein [Mycobacterium kyorinense]|uniref:SHOCT domain-containing protein n=1 Tax=Mycobacterium kyorinense TaxID=487514 RepID=A0A1X1XLZ9_9MYCO|nr:SHOCT domain-containing protein [Mycobacterium kyorinense]ORV99809.1 hypothetical protein AWC14_11755 [Mycobacterium kyorinense]
MVASVLTLVVAVIGFAITLILNLFVLDEYNAYGEVPIPGSGSVQLPAGQVTVSFHTEVISSPSGGGLPVPRLGMRIDPPDGVPDPAVTESYGNTRTVNNDAHIQVWVVQVPAAGTYNVTTDGQVNGYISPRLAFGHKSSYGWLVWAFVVLFGIALVSLVCTVWWSGRTRSSRQGIEPIASYTPSDLSAPRLAPASSYAASDEAVKLQQLKTLSELRDSGALTQAEFQAEKRRILDGR